jgi:hypothetical protein
LCNSLTSKLLYLCTHTETDDSSCREGVIIKKGVVMIVNTIIAAIALALIMLLPIVLKMWLDPDGKDNNQTDAHTTGGNACGACGLKDISNCALDGKSHAAGKAEIANIKTD